MCLNPVTILNPKRSVSLSGGHQFTIQVPCGKCAECRERQKNEWYFRSYYEAQRTFDAGGYILFDTLTYDGEHLPHLNDYLPGQLQVSSMLNLPCFSTEHLRKFFVRLRRQLQYHGFDPARNLKYFVTSEYGDDDRYTHRPHYHVLFFVTDPSLDPLVLSSYVNKCWQNGRTDGIDYQSSLYVLNHVFSPKYNADRIHLQSVCNYVAKYITKDSVYSSGVESRLGIAFDRLFGKNWRNNDPDNSVHDLYQRLLRQVLQFHRQSKGFGDCLLQYNNLDDILQTGMIAMPDKDDIVRHMPLPSYYHRKLFYNLVRDCHNRLQWDLNELGHKYKFNRARQCVDLLTVRFTDWLESMRSHSYYKSESSVSDWCYDYVVSNFERINDGRPLAQFASYLVYYKGRVKTVEQLQAEQSGMHVAPSPEELYHLSLGESPVRTVQIGDSSFSVPVPQSSSSLYFYGDRHSVRKFGTRFFTDKYLPVEDRPAYLESWFEYVCASLQAGEDTPSVFDPVNDLNFGDLTSVKEFKSRFVMDDRCDVRFKGYDAMWSLYCESQLAKSRFKQESYDMKEALKKRLKKIGVFTKNL